MANNILKLKNKFKDNIIKWYPFEPNTTKVEIVDSLEGIENKQYDYVILLGAMKYAKEMFQGKNPKKQLIEYAKEHLKENGKILIAVNNKIGIDNYCKKSEKEEQKLTKVEIEELLESCNLNYYKFYYALPNYEMTNVLFTDEFLPNQETISRDITLYDEGDIWVHPELKFYLDLINEDNKLFKIFSNSYLIECSKKEFEDNKIKFISFSNIRKEEYSIQTVIKEDKVYKTAGNEKASNHIENIKKNIDLLNKLGIKTLDTYKENTIISDFQKDGQTLDNIIIEKINEHKKEEAVEIIIKFFEEVEIKLKSEDTEKNIFDEYGIKYTPEQMEKLTFTKYGLWDLIFQNAFYINGEFLFYDQEWKKDGIPIQYILYRSIQYTKGLKENLDIEKIWNRFGIEEKHLELFYQLDNKLQEETRDNEVWEWHSDFPMSVDKLKDEVKKLEKDKTKITNDCNKLLNEKDARIKFLEDNMEKTVELLHQKENEVNIKNSEIARKDNEIKIIGNEITAIKNSLSWKITSPLRKLKRKKNKNN